MRDERDAMMVVRAELCDRLDQLRGLWRRGSATEFDKRLEGMRLLADAYGLAPVARIAEALQCSRGPAPLYFDRLRDAIRCDRVDEEAAQAMLASVSVRLGA